MDIFEVDWPFAKTSPLPSENSLERYLENGKAMYTCIYSGKRL